MTPSAVLGPVPVPASLGSAKCCRLRLVLATAKSVLSPNQRNKTNWAVCTERQLATSLKKVLTALKLQPHLFFRRAILATEVHNSICNSALYSFHL